MRPIKWTLVLILIAIAAVSVAQQRDAASLNPEFPVPVWPSNGVIPDGLKNHYVFVDPAKNEFVVAYPGNLGSPNFEKDGPKDRLVSRYKLQRDVDPAVNAVITAAPGGRFKYAYTVVDAPKAKQSIDQWALVMPEAGAGTVTKQPAGWFGVVQKSRKFTVTNPDWIKTGSAVVFSYDKPAEQIQPGSIKGGFEVESDLKPGFTLGFFRQAESVEAVMQTSGNIPRAIIQNATPPPPTTTAGGPPPEGQGQRGFGGNQVPAGATAAWEPIKADVDKVLQFEYDSKAVLTLAPKFDKNASDKVIATDYLQGLTTLTKTGGLAADSAFAKTTISELDAYVKAGGTGPLKLSAQPKGDLETQIFNAMKLSLHVN
jgi:hypothetical protein